MPNGPFTPEQIAQILEEFFKTVGTRQYIGSRYVPIFGRKDEDSIEWDNTGTYEPLTIVLYQGNSYTSRQYVPVGVEITNQEFWALTGNYNAQVEQYRRETAAVKAQADNIEASLPITDFSSSMTVKDYIDTEIQTVEDDISDINDALPATYFDETNTIKSHIDALELALPISSFDSSHTVEDAIERITDPTYVNYYGADPTGAEDSSAAIAAAIAANKGGCIKFISGTYRISEPIRLVNEVNDGVTQRTSVDFCGSTIIPSDDMDYVIVVGYNPNGTQNKSAHIANAYVANGYLENDDTYTVTYGIVCESESCYNYIFENMSVKGFDVGIKLCSINETNSRPCDLIIDNCIFISGTPYKEGSYGIHSRYATDSKVTNTKIQGFQYAFYYFSGISINCHVLTYGYIGSEDYLNSAVIAPNGGTFIKLYSDSYPTLIYAGGTRNITTNLYACNMYTYSDEEINYCFAKGTSIENFQGNIDVRVSLQNKNFSFISGPTAVSGNTNPAQWSDFNAYVTNINVTGETDVFNMSKNTPTYDTEKNYASGDYVLLGRIACCGAHHTPIDFEITHPEEHQFSRYSLDVHNNSVGTGFDKGYGNYNGNTELYACTHMKDGIIYVDVYSHFTTAHSNYTLPFISNVVNGINVRPVVWSPASSYSRPTATALTEIPAAYAGTIKQLTLAS